VDFSPDGKTLASAGDRSLRLWHVGTRQEIASFTHPMGVRFTRFSPDGRCLAYSLERDRLMLLRCPSLAEIDAEMKREGANGFKLP
jgi:WD40 repeat protein